MTHVSQFCRFAPMGEQLECPAYGSDAWFSNCVSGEHVTSVTLDKDEAQRLGEQGFRVISKQIKTTEWAEGRIVSLHADEENMVFSCPINAELHPEVFDQAN